MTEIKIVPAIPYTKPTFSHAEAEDLMAILLNSGHPRAEYLAAKLVTHSGDPAVYAKTLARVRTNVILNSGEHVNGDPIPAQLLQKLVEAQFPEAADFEPTSWLDTRRHEWEGLTFRAGERFRFAVSNGYVSKAEFGLRTVASDGFREYVENHGS